jgi:hypothetical protein
VTLNPPTSPTARPATPTFDDYAASPAHDAVRLAPTPIAPQPRPFSPLDMHPHRPPTASPQTQHLAPVPFPNQLAFKPTRPDSPPPASRQPHDAIRTDAALPEPLEANDQGDEPWVSETSTKLSTRALYTSTSPTRPPGYSNMTNGKRRRLRKHDSRQRKNSEKSAQGDGGGS